MVTQRDAEHSAFGVAGRLLRPERAVSRHTPQARSVIAPGSDALMSGAAAIPPPAGIDRLRSDQRVQTAVERRFGYPVEQRPFGLDLRLLRSAEIDDRQLG